MACARKSNTPFYLVFCAVKCKFGIVLYRRRSRPPACREVLTSWRLLWRRNRQHREESDKLAVCGLSKPPAHVESVKAGGIRHLETASIERKATIWRSIVQALTKTNACKSYCASSHMIVRKAVSDKTLLINYEINKRHTTSWGSLNSGHNIWYCTKLNKNFMPFTCAFHR